MSRYIEPFPDAFPERLNWLQRYAFFAGVGGLAISFLAFLIDRHALLSSYLAAFIYWCGIAVGCTAIVLLHELVGGLWGFLIRRPLEAAVSTLPLLLVLFLPILLGLRVLYPWAQPELVAADIHLQRKAAYLNVGFFIVRAVIYFGLWITIALVLKYEERAQDRTEDPSPTWQLQTFSGPALVLHFIAVTFAMIDWGMSLEPKYYSSIYGPMILIGSGLNAFAIMILVTSRLVNVRPMADLAKPVAFHDLGNLMLAFVMLWAYFSFSQFLITWSGNLTEEIPWYLHRSEHGWRWMAAFLIFFHFFIPFFFLLFRENKRRPQVLAIGAAWIAVVHIFDVAWLILPSCHYIDEKGKDVYRSIFVYWPYIFTWIGIGGLCVAYFIRQLKQMPLVPLHDPVLAEAIEHSAAQPEEE